MQQTEGLFASAETIASPSYERREGISVPEAPPLSGNVSSTPTLV